MKTFVPQGAYFRYAYDNNSSYHILEDDKILFHNNMQMYNLPVPERFFVYQEGRFIKKKRLFLMINQTTLFQK